MYASISGSGAVSGKMAEQAAKACEKYVNDNGGIKALGGKPVEVVIVDSGSDASQALLPLERALADEEIVAVVGHATSAIALVELEALEEHEILGLTASASNNMITQSGCSWVLQPAPYADEFGKMQVEFLEYLAPSLGKELKDINIGLVYENSAWGTQNAEGTEATIKEYGQKLVSNEPYEANALTDATSIVTKMKNAGVEVIFPSCYANDAKLIMTACKSLDYNPIIVGGGSAFTWPSLYDDLGDLANGIFSTDNSVHDQKNALNCPEYLEIEKIYEDSYGEFVSGQAFPTIACFMLVCEAIENTGSTNRADIKNEIFSMTNETSKWMAVFNGDYAKIDENGHNVGATPIVLQWQNGEPTCVYPEASAASEILNPETLQPF